MDVLKGLAGLLGMLLAAAGLTVGLAAVSNALLPYDSTDPPGGRSGMTIYTDQATGCEYLSNRGLTPRVDGKGRHLGCRQ
jgi:hypothetical protein